MPSERRRRRLLRGRRYVHALERTKLHLAIANEFARFAAGVAREPWKATGRIAVVQAIADKLGCDASHVSRTLKRLDLEWREETAETYATAKSDMLGRLDWIEAEARREWERSKAENETLVTEQDVIEREVRDVTTGEKRTVREPSGTVTIRRTIKGQTGAPAYLETLRGVEADRRKMLGLDAPVKSLPGEGGDTTPTLAYLQLLAPRILQVVIDTTRDEMPLQSIIDEGTARIGASTSETSKGNGGDDT